MAVVKNKVPSQIVIHVKCTDNNIIITLTDLIGNVLSSMSSGRLSLKGSQKTTPYAAQNCINKLLGNITNMDALIAVDVRMKGKVSHCRDLIIRSIISSCPVRSISESNSKPHNGCRSPKRRRI